MFRIPLIDIVMAFSSAIDLICPQLSDHNKRVAYIAYSIAKEMGLDDKEMSNILMASLLHDCGAIKDDEKMRAARYDFGITASERHNHGYMGWRLLCDIEELETAAEIIKFHHIHWDEPNSSFTDGEEIPFGSHIIHLADRIDVLINRKEEILGQRTSIESKIRGDSGKMFMPDAVEAFIMLSARGYFWFDLTSAFIDQMLSKFMVNIKAIVDEDKLLLIAGALNKLVDYRSSFTASHSTGVAACASILSSKMNFSKERVQMMNIAGLLHDLGKLAISGSILEKNGPLSQYEFNIMKKHTYFTYRILERIPQIETINSWASFHHERIDGSGYPFSIQGKDLSQGSRIMAISDVFTALTEERPYRRAMSIKDALDTINNMVGKRYLDGDIFSVFSMHIEEINQHKLNVQNSVISTL